MAVRYEVVPQTRSGNARPRPYAADEPLDPGDTIVLKGRWWLVERVEPSANGGLPRAFLVEPRYRLRLRHPDGREEVGAFRRFRPDAPGIGHSFTTIEDGHPAAWAVVDQGLARDEEGRPYIDLIAERDFGELEELPDHELEHALAARDASIPEAASATISRAEAAGLAVELVLLEAGDEPGWDDARTYIDALILEEIEDDLFEQCGVDTDRDPRETWLATVNDRLHADLGSFRADVEGDHDEIEEWEFLGGRIFASVGSFEDESDPVSGHGWMCRLVDSSALGAAGFKRVRKIEL